MLRQKTKIFRETRGISLNVSSKSDESRQGFAEKKYGLFVSTFI